MSGRGTSMGRGRGRGLPGVKKPPDKNPQAIPTASQSAMRSQWNTEPGNGSFHVQNNNKSVKRQNQTSPGKTQPSSKVKLDISHEDTNTMNAQLKEARQNLRTTTPLADAAASLVKRLSPNAKAGAATTSGASNASPPAGTSIPQRSQSMESIISQTSDPDESEEAVTVTMKCEGANFNQISSIKVTRVLRDILSIEDVRSKPTKEGDLKIIVEQNKVGMLTSLESFMSFRVITVDREVISNHSGPRDYIWGKIFSQNLFNCEDGEILEELQAENDDIIEAKRIFRGKDKRRTRLIKVRFSSTQLPESVYCLKVKYNVIPFIPPVKKCYKCNMYNNHWTRDCRNTWVCELCNKTDCPSKPDPDNNSESASCPNPPHCKYCGPGHTTRDNNCPRYQKEREIVNISYEKNISFQNARSKVEDGDISNTTASKLAASSNSNHNKAKQGTAYSNAVKANLLGNVTLADIGTGLSEGESSGFASDSMGEDIDNTILNPGDYVVKYASPWLFLGFEQNLDGQHEVDSLKDMFQWVESAPEGSKVKFKNLVKRFMVCFKMIQNNIATHQPEHLLNV